MGQLRLNDKVYTGQASSDGFHVYSTNEQIVGKWVDGRAVYERSYQLSNTITVSVSDWTDTGVIIQGGELVDIKAIYHQVDGLVVPVIGNINSQGKVYIIGLNSTSRTLNTLIIQYTKSSS